MKNFSNILSILSFIGVCILGVLHYKQNNISKPHVLHANTSDTAKKMQIPGGNIAYVDLDTLENNYTFFKKKKAEFEARDKAIGIELESMQTNLQNEYIALQKKAQAGTLGQVEGEAAQKKLVQKQQDLEMSKQTKGSQLLKDQEEFNKSLQQNIRGYLNDYATEKGYDYVMAYTSTSTILFANKDLEITKDVLDALNNGTIKNKK